MTTISFFLCLTTIAAAGALQSPRILLHSLLKRIFGSLIFALALLPVFIDWPDSIKTFGLPFIFNNWIAGVSMVLSVAIVILNSFTASTAGNLATYPQIRRQVWSLAHVLQSSLAWIVYLALYEVVFRGVFFFTSVRLLGFWPAAFLNIAAYSLAHLIKNKREAFLSIPFGALTIYLTWASGSCWYAVLVHIVLAISHEWSSIRANPNMRFEFSFTERNSSL